MMNDAEEYEHFVFAEKEVGRLADWSRDPTVAAARIVAEHLESQVKPSFCDYACGPGVASRVLANVLTDPHEVALHCVDLKNPWFEIDPAVLGQFREASTHELNPAGSILSLDAVLPARSVDALWTSMAIHLFPIKAWDRIFSGWATALRTGGLVVYSTPDLGPASPGAELIHTVPRMCRQVFEEVHRDQPASVDGLLELCQRVAGLPPSPDSIGTAELAWLLRTARGSDITAESVRRARQHIAPQPPSRKEIHEALSEHFSGGDEVIDLAVGDGVCHRMMSIPSNHQNLFNDVEQRSQRRFAVSLCRLLESAVPTGRITWTIGAYRKE